MDLIKLKEGFCPNTHPDFKPITKFISWLLDIQTDGGSDKIREVLGPFFFKKQEMIEYAFQIAKLNVFGDDKK